MIEIHVIIPMPNGLKTVIINDECKYSTLIRQAKRTAKRALRHSKYIRNSGNAGMQPDVSDAYTQ